MDADERGARQDGWAVCPACGAAEPDSRSLGEEGLIVCESCGAPYRYRRRVLFECEPAPEVDARDLLAIPLGHRVERWFRLNALEPAPRDEEGRIDYIEVLEDIEVSCGPDAPVYPDWDIDGFARFFVRLLRQSAAAERSGWLDAHAERILEVPLMLPEATGDDGADAEAYVRAIAGAIDVGERAGEVDVGALCDALRRLIAPKRAERGRWPEMSYLDE